ncbi:MAG TPA: H-type lectin domain-containing protein [Longimicrobium sp.]|jgi:hypothetical protein|nr:H-type lectin domain-containing protein [Longimicrobium sp.]
MQIQAGTVSYGYGTSGWTLNIGSGARSFTTPDITFPTAFSTPPTMIVALYGVDAGNSANLRLTVATADIEASEFNVVFNTWADSVIYTVWVSWIAFTP